MCEAVKYFFGGVTQVKYCCSLTLADGALDFLLKSPPAIVYVMAFMLRFQVSQGKVKNHPATVGFNIFELTYINFETLRTVKKHHPTLSVSSPEAGSIGFLQLPQVHGHPAQALQVAVRVLQAGSLVDGSPGAAGPDLSGAKPFNGWHKNIQKTDQNSIVAVEKI